MREDQVNKPTVLIVDDSRVVVNILERMLRSEYQVITAGNGQEALELIEQTANISMVISDLWMPVMDGFEFLLIWKNLPTPKSGLFRSSWYLPVRLMHRSGKNLKT